MTQNGSCLWRFWRSPRSSVFLLGLHWMLGLLLGLFSAVYSGSDVLSLMRGALDSRMSIVGAAAAVIFPLIVTWFAASFSIPMLLPFLAFFRAYICSFCACCYFRVFGSAAWLAQFLFLFSEILTTVPLLWLWFRYLCGNIRSFKVEFFLISIYFSFIGYLNYSRISPFLAELFS